MLIQGIKLRRQTLCASLIAECGGFLFGSALLFVITLLVGNNVIKDDSYTVALVGTMISMLIFFIICVIGGIIEVGTNFNQFVGFGMTRLKFFVQELATSYVFILVSMAGLFVLNLIERMIIKLPFYNQYEYEVLFTDSAFLNIIVVTIIALPIIRLFLGSVLLKFGKSKGFWVIWALWMVGCLSPSFIGDIMREGPKNSFQSAIYNIVTSITNVSAVIWICIGCALLVVFLIASWLFIKDKAVEV